MFYIIFIILSILVLVIYSLCAISGKCSRIEEFNEWRNKYKGNRTNNKKEKN